tara:strand:- start:185 stop:565 length:381 start_codon:yes stop_codon:yes gene_type:complete
MPTQSGRTRKERDYSKPSQDEFSLAGKPIEMDKLNLQQRKIYAAAADSLVEDLKDLDMKGRFEVMGSIADMSQKDDKAIEVEYLQDKWRKERNELAEIIYNADPAKGMPAALKEANNSIDWEKPTK